MPLQITTHYLHNSTVKVSTFPNLAFRSNFASLDLKGFLLTCNSAVMLETSEDMDPLVLA